MKVTILGARANIANKEIVHDGYARFAGILIDDKLLFDIGDQEYVQLRPRAVFITHFHNDHAYFVHGQVQPPLMMFGPPNHFGIAVLSAPMDIEDYRVTPVPTQHAPNISSQGYLIEHGGKRMRLLCDP